MGQKFYDQLENGTITLKSERRHFDVGIPAYVYDLWMPLIGLEAIGLYGVFVRLFWGRTRHIGLRRLAKGTGKGRDGLRTLIGKLEDVGALQRTLPTEQEQRDGKGSTYTLYDFPMTVTPEIIAKYKPEGYQPLTYWFVEHAAPPGSGYDHPRSQIDPPLVPDGTTTVLSIDRDTKEYAGNPQDFHAHLGSAIKGRMPSPPSGTATDRDSSDKKKISATDPNMPSVGRLVFQILSHGTKDVHSLTQDQVRDLQADVICATRPKPYPSPQTEYEAYPMAFENFCKTVHEAAYFKQPKNGLTPGNIIKFLRNYDGYQGWFKYRPGGSEVKQVIENTEDSYLTRLNRGDFDEG